MSKLEDLQKKVNSLGFRVLELEHPTRTVKPLAFSEGLNTPCTAELEIKLQKLAAYFTRRAKENTKRSADRWLQEKSTYYFSGKADTYTRAAQKITELLGEESKRYIHSIKSIDVYVNLPKTNNLPKSPAFMSAQEAGAECVICFEEEGSMSCIRHHLAKSAQPVKEQWKVECYYPVSKWAQSIDYPDTYPSKVEAEKQFAGRDGYRAVRVL